MNVKMQVAESSQLTFTCSKSTIETPEQATDQGKEYGELFTDISKAFDCLAYDVLIAELYVYGFSIESLNLINDYLTER